MAADNCGIRIYKDEEFEVWCGVDGDNIINAHIIGLGSTKNAAIARAVADLEAKLLVLQETPDLPVTDVSRPIV